MFQFFKNKFSRGKQLEMKDLDGNDLRNGDMVNALRYDLGVCKISKDQHGFVYDSIETKKQVSWVKMVDATTKFQKVRIISSN